MSGHRLVTPGRDLHERARRAVADPQLQRALHNLDIRLHTSDDVARGHAEVKHRAAAIRRATLADLEGALGDLEASLTRAGAVVHRCATPDDARDAVLAIMETAGARRVIKGKSMATEEIDLNSAIEGSGARVVETDLGEFIVQVAGERPSHMITPAIHKTLEQIAVVLEAEAGEPLPVVREDLTAWARAHLRADMLAGDLGITGVNFAVAETGTLVVVTNEGNGRFCSTWPRVHVAVMTVEKVVRNFSDLATLLPLLTMSATGQRLSNYVTMITGPRRPGELDGPDELHVIVLDHGRTAALGTPYEDMLACVRCGACLNVCPVYRTIGGHAYDAVYPGPMGSVLTPLLSAGAEGADLPEASSLCGACSDACPVEIPLVDLLVRLRADRGRPGSSSRTSGALPNAVPLTARAPGRRGRAVAWDAWARVWSSPRGYEVSGRAARVLAIGTHGARWRRRGFAPWTKARDLPVPAPQSFHRVVERALSSLASQFLAATAEQSCTTHGPLSAPAATTLVARRCGEIGGLVAMSDTEPVLSTTALIAGLDMVGVETLAPDAADWRTRIPTAAVGITIARVAVAQLGVFAVEAAPRRPRAVSLLPETHICLVAERDVVDTFAAALERVAGAPFPSALLWIGGPSRTGDLEMITTLGVHGPRAVEIVVVSDTAVRPGA